MKKKIFLPTLLIGVVLAGLPLVDFLMGHPLVWLNTETMVALNLVGWSVALTLFFSRLDLTEALVETAERFGIHTGLKSLEHLLERIKWEVYRKRRSLSTDILEKKIASEKELTQTLERIVALSFELLRAESAELALFDSDTGMFHSAFVLGKPFKSSAQAMLSGAIEGEEAKPTPDVLIQPIAFAGSVLGTLRVGLRKRAIPTISDRELMSTLALQAGLAILNAEYSKQLIKMKENADETVKAKTGFLANLSHEIRGPLGIIINAVELVLDELCGPLNEEQIDTLRLVRTNGEHLLELINDVLDYAKVESGNLQPKSEKIVLNNLLKEMGDIVRAQADAKGHKVRFINSEDLLLISCDKRHIRQMLINLLTNSIKYTEEGGLIEIWAERLPAGKIKINVRDSGVGIEESQQYKVFSAFERVSSSYSMKQIGTGLGMPLTKKLCEANGGKIDFSSTKSEGSHFWLIFPALENSSVGKINEREESTPKEAYGKNEVILLVETDEGERKMTERYLEHLGYRVITTTTTQAALELLRKGGVDLLLLDNKLVDRPDENFVSSVRSAARSTLLPIILISSRAFVFDIEKYLKAGIDLCLTKPIAFKDLSRSIRELLESREVKLKRDDTDKEEKLSKSTVKPDDLLH